MSRYAKLPDGILGRLLKGDAIPLVLATAEEFDHEWADRVQEKLAKCRLGLKVEKTEPDRMEAYGWASVVEIDGKPVVDLDNEVITEADLDAFVRKFVLGRHGGKVMHEGQIEADLIESMMFTREKQAALGIDLGRVGWWIGMKYRRPEVWAKLKSGELPMFSLSGYAVPKPIPANGA